MSEHKKEEKLEAADQQIMSMPIFWFQQEESMTIKRISDKHPVFLISNFLSGADCEWIINNNEKFAPSTTVKGDRMVESKDRTSTTALLTASGKACLENSILYSIQVKASALSGYPISNIESINLTCYKEGQYFLPHHDYFDLACVPIYGQRIATFFIYLNDVPEENGGRTNFIDLDLSVQPKRGSCLFWLNTDFTGMVFYPLTRHEGQLLTKGEKYALNVWVRKDSYK